MTIHTFHQISLHFTSLHFTSLYLNNTSPPPQFFTSLHFWTFRHHHSKPLHFSTLPITFLTLFLKTCDLQVTVASISTGSSFHNLTVLLTKQYLQISVLCFLSLILQSWPSLLRYHGSCNLSPTTFHAHTLAYAVNRTQMLAIFLRCTKISHT
jgi:hypothetical protein